LIEIKDGKVVAESVVTLCYARFQSGYVAKALRDDGAPLPAAVVGSSVWVD
jgi:hypothetical protein